MNKDILLNYTAPQLEMFFDIDPSVRFLVVSKGRRFGATKGACNALIEWLLEGKKILWGDTINSNIDRYFERYILPELKRNNIEYHYSKQSKQLTISNGYCDFRSADNPENWEGFGYDIIILNEAGIILKNKYLYTNAVLPMLMDNPGSLLIAMGAPKGKKLKDGTEHPFYTLAKAAENKQKGYKYLKYSSYDNPILSTEDIKDLESEIGRMNPAMVQQEIYGEFIDGANLTLWSPEMIKHVTDVPHLRRIVVGVDPSGSVNGDETGIITAGITSDNRIFVLSDKTKACSPLTWGTLVCNEYKAMKADSVVAERNYGGDMVKANILSVDNMVRVKEVHASRGKDVRAEPVVALYEQLKVFHVRGLHDLESEMLTWVPGEGKSPNRVDALVWAITELYEGKKEVRIGL